MEEEKRKTRKFFMENTLLRKNSEGGDGHGDDAGMGGGRITSQDMTDLTDGSASVRSVTFGARTKN